MKNNPKKMITTKLIALVPIIIFGFYKNGLFLYNKDLITFMQMFKPLLLIVIGFSITILIEYIFCKEKNKFKILENINILDGVLITMLMPPNINIFIYSSLLIVLLLFSRLLFKYFKFNQISFIKIIMYLILIVVLKLDYNNVYESSSTAVISTFDLLMGKGSGGILTTSIIGSIIGYMYLATDFSYKKEIPFFITVSFFMFMLIYGVIQNDIMLPFKLLMSKNFLFATIFIAPETLSSPYTKKGKILYGIIIGIISSILIALFNLEISIFISIFIVSLIFPFLDQIFYQKHKIEA